MDKDKWLEQQQAIEDTKWKLAKQLEAENEQLAEEMRKNGEIVNTYTCQKCHRDFVTREIYVIIKDEQPLCKFCKKEKEELDNWISTGNEGVEV